MLAARMLARTGCICHVGGLSGLLLSQAQASNLHGAIVALREKAIERGGCD